MGELVVGVLAGEVSVAACVEFAVGVDGEGVALKTGVEVFAGEGSVKVGVEPDVGRVGMGEPAVGVPGFLPQDAKITRRNIMKIHPQDLGEL